MPNQYATQTKTGDAWGEPMIFESEAAAFDNFEAIKRFGLADAVSVLSRSSENKPWQVCANARKKFGYIS